MLSFKFELLFEIEFELESGVAAEPLLLFTFSTLLNLVEESADFCLFSKYLNPKVSVPGTVEEPDEFLGFLWLVKYPKEGYTPFKLLLSTSSESDEVDDVDEKADDDKNAGTLEREYRNDEESLTAEPSKS